MGCVDLNQPGPKETLTRGELVCSGERFFGDEWRAKMAEWLHEEPEIIKAWESGAIPVDRVAAICINGRNDRLNGHPRYL